MLTEEQYNTYEKLLEDAREQFPDALDYNLQLLCFKLARDGNLEANTSKEDIDFLKSQYDNTTTHFTTPA